MPRLDFWFDFASTYSYLSAMRIDAAAARAGVEVAWQPFLLGPIFKAQGWETSPFNLYPAKGRYMVRDLERLTAARGLPFRMPAVFPANGLKAARMALVGAAEGWIAPFSRAVFVAEFARGADIADDAVLKGVLEDLKIEATDVTRQTGTEALKQQLRDQTERAAALGIFGAPAFITPDGQLFWGDDRLDHALEWAARS